MADKCAVILLSGGVDSATAAAMAREQGFELHALSFRYGQRHERELASAQKIANYLHAQIAQRNCLRSSRDRWFRADRPNRSPQATQRIRNLPRHSHHLRAGAQHDLSGICIGARRADRSAGYFFGANQLDYSGYPDCREEYIQAFERMANLATKAGVEGKSRIRIHTPLLKMTKAEIIRAGLKLGLDYGLTWSCYDPLPMAARADDVTVVS